MNSLVLLEKLRIKVLIYSVIFIILLILLAISLLIFSNALFSLMFLVLFLFVKKMKGKVLTKYKNNYKEVFVNDILNKVILNLEYKPKNGLTKEFVKNTHLIDTGDVFISNDYFRGSYKNVDLTFSNINIQEKSSIGVKTSFLTTFRGNWMIFSFNKKFKSNVRIIENGFFGVAGNGLLLEYGYKNIKMEDVEFNKKFQTQAIDGFDAFYIMTPHMMHRIKRLTAKSKGKMIFGFINNDLHIVNASGKNIFEPSIYIKNNEKEIIKLINSQISLVTQFVEELKLDDDLFK